MSEGRRLPLHSRTGEVRGWTLVDADDFEHLNQWRWSLHSEGYACRQERQGPGRGKKRVVMLHRFLLGLVPRDGVLADHRNGNRLDNRRANLRRCDRTTNPQNQGSRGGRSRHRGVTLDKSSQRWRASVVLNGRRHHLGYFEHELAAAAAASQFRAVHMPYSADARADEKEITVV